MNLPFFKKSKTPTLLNPQKEEEEIDFEAEIVGDEVEEVPKEQVKMDLKHSKMEPIYKIRRSITNIEKQVEVIPFWKNAFTSIALVFSIALVLIVIGILVFSFESLPNEVPLFYNTNISTWDLIDKGYYLFIPLILSAIIFLLWRLLYIVFTFDERLARVSIWTLLMLSIFGIIGISQIITIVLI